MIEKITELTGTGERKFPIPMRETRPTPEENEGELYQELQKALVSKNYDRIIELAQELKKRQNIFSFSQGYSEQQRPIEANWNNPIRERYLKFASTGFAELSENERPLFLQLDIDTPTSVGDSRKVLLITPSKQAAYILFPIDSHTGCLYPNPKISFSESMKYIWPSLNHNNWPSQIASHIQSVKVMKVREGVWMTEGNVK